MGAMSDLVNLSAGEPNFPTPDHIKEAGRQAITDDFTHYTPQPGFDDLREAVAEKFRSENRVAVDARQIVVSCGGKHSLYSILQCALEPGAEVIVFTPHWFAYPEQVRRAGGRPVRVETREDTGFFPSPDAIRCAITENTRALVLNSPCNPTGAVFPRGVLEEIACLANENDLLVIADEVYEKILFDGAEHVSIGSLGPEIAARTATVNSVSKTHAMTGWRIGYAAMPPPLVDKVTALQGVSTSGPCAIAQRAALAALTGDQSHVRRMVQAYAARRERLLERVGRIEGWRSTAPAGTFYLFVTVAGWLGRRVGGHTIKDADSLVAVAQREAGVLLVSGSGFGAPHHIRLSFAISDQTIEEGMDRIERLQRKAAQ